MPSDNEIEQRLLALEKEMAELRSRISTRDSADAWPDRAFGAMREFDESAFTEFVELGKEFRDSQTDPQAS